MKLLVLMIIALAWGGWVVSWIRDRQMSTMPLGRLSKVPTLSRWDAPRTEMMARRRRREVLVALASVAIFSLLLAQFWSLMWFVHVLADVALLAYGYAVMTIERPDALDSLRSSLRPVALDEPGQPAEAIDVDRDQLDPLQIVVAPDFQRTALR